MSKPHDNPRKFSAKRLLVSAIFLPEIQSHCLLQDQAFLWPLLLHIHRFSYILSELQFPWFVPSHCQLIYPVPPPWNYNYLLFFPFFRLFQSVCSFFIFPDFHFYYELIHPDFTTSVKKYQPVYCLFLSLLKQSF